MAISFEVLLSVPLFLDFFFLCLKFHVFAMDVAPVCVKFTGNNYSSWAFQFELFLKGKDLWAILMARMLHQRSILMARILHQHLTLTSLRMSRLLLPGMCLMLESCLGFLVQ